MKEVEESVGPPRKEVRQRREQERFSSVREVLTILNEYEPTTYGEESMHQVWRDAMMEEYNSIMKNGVWEIVLRPEGKSVVTSKWLYKIKHVASGSIEKYKA